MISKELFWKLRCPWTDLFFFLSDLDFPIFKEMYILASLHSLIFYLYIKDFEDLSKIIILFCFVFAGLSRPTRLRGMADHSRWCDW